MPSDFFGVPTHPLVVHAVVALVPLAALLAILVAVWPRFRRQFSIPTAVVTVLALLTIPLATSSGENLRARLPENPLIRRHAELADGLLPFALVLAVAAVGLAVLERRRRTVIGEPSGAPVREPVAAGHAGPPARPSGPTSSTAGRQQSPVSGGARLLSTLAAVLMVVAALGSAVQVVRIGHAGAKATYQGTPSQPRPDAPRG
jgi:hypothetical protein